MMSADQIKQADRQAEVRPATENPVASGAHDQADEQLAAEEGHQDAKELAHEEHHIVPVFLLQEGQVIGQGAGRVVVGEQEEKQINRDDGQ